MDTIAISIIGEPNPFWLWGGRTFWWRLTPIWTPLPRVPSSVPIANDEPSTPETIPIGDGEVPQEPQTETSPSSPTHQKRQHLPWWGYVVSVVGMTVTLVVILGCSIKHFRDYKAHQQFEEASQALLDGQEESDLESDM
jgi:hypothetical protein